MTPEESLIRFAVARSLFAPTTLPRAIERLGFVQADPIRSPARAQDLTLRHRVRGYRAGDLERRYAELDVEEDAYINYGFLPRPHVALMHPRVPRRAWDARTRKRAAVVLEFVRERGEVHPREVDARFSHGRVTNYWGGSSNATTQLLDGMHYRGLLRVARREGGVRIYAPREPIEPEDESPAARADALLAVAVAKYAPVTTRGLGQLAARLRYGAPQLASELRPAIERAKSDLARMRAFGTDWYFPAGERPARHRDATEDRVRFLAPFDPVVWDRARFETFWGWAYRFEAYTPAAKRKLGYYALPLLWRERVIGWANVRVDQGALAVDLGYVSGRAPRERAYAQALEREVESMRAFV